MLVVHEPALKQVAVPLLRFSETPCRLSRDTVFGCSGPQEPPELYERPCERSSLKGLCPCYGPGPWAGCRIQGCSRSATYR
jgi:hypothetical protein